MTNKILVIENDVAMCENIAELLSISGYEVQTSLNGEEGLEKATWFKPDVILCDVIMPELDGYGVLNKLRSMQTFKAPPVILLTAMSETKDRSKAMENGVAGYVVKPFFDEELLQMIRILLPNKPE